VIQGRTWKVEAAELEPGDETKEYVVLDRPVPVLEAPDGESLDGWVGCRVLWRDGGVGFRMWPETALIEVSRD
jgi:hypothetical protein